jgi:uncharacterized protein YjiS (DUF1127 family)
MSMSHLTRTAVAAGEPSSARTHPLRRRVMAWFVARAQRRALLELERMDDRLLRDIGIDRDTLRNTLTRRPGE